MALEGPQPLKISVPCSAALQNAAYNEWNWMQTEGASWTEGQTGGQSPLQYTFVKINSSGYADLLGALTDQAIGVIQNRPFVPSKTSSQVAGTAVAEIVVVGVTKLVAGQAITLGTSLGIGACYALTINSIAMVGAASSVTALTGSTKLVYGAALPVQGLVTPLVTVAAGSIFRAAVNCIVPLPTGTSSAT